MLVFSPFIFSRLWYRCLGRLSGQLNRLLLRILLKPRIQWEMVNWPVCSMYLSLVVLTILTFYPALPYGPPGSEKFTLNRDTLWSGGPFENASYIGGNTVPSVNSALPGIRDYIFANGQGNVSALMGTAANYGSYRVLGNFSVGIKGVEKFMGYKRVLDLETGVYSTSFGVGSTGFNTWVFFFFCLRQDGMK